MRNLKSLLPSLFAAFAAAFMLSSCSSDEPVQREEINDLFENNEPSKPRVDIPLSRSESEIVNNLTDFSFDVLKSVETIVGNNNVVISPFSLSSVLSMMSNGAKGETLTELLDVLKSDNLDELNQLNKKLHETLPNLDNNARFNSANAVFYDNVELTDNFISTAKNFFNTTLESYESSSLDDLRLINNWCNNNTWGMINKLSDEPINARVAILNVTAFMARWSSPFNEAKTTYGPLFTTESGTKQMVYQMHNEYYRMRYYKGDNYEATSLSYGNGAFAFTIILPDETVGVADVVSELNYSEIEKIKNSEQFAQMYLTLPRFKIENKLSLDKILSAIGLKKALGKDADYSNMSDLNSFFLIKQTAVIEVLESGTKAAAVTGGLYGSAAPNTIPPVEFNVNRPFIFVISEKSSGLILFAGVVKNP